MIALAFVAGLVAFVSPCFFPLVPVLAAYLGGDSARTTTAMPALAGSRFGSDGFIVSRASAAQAAVEADRATRRRSRSFVGAIAFVLGFSTVFVTFWVAVALVGLVVADIKPLMRMLGGSVMVVFGAATAGLFTLPTLKSARPKHRDGVNVSASQGFLLGCAYGAGATPCFGPLLASVLGMILVAETAGAGLLLLLVFCLGFGLPIVLVTVGFTQLLDKLGWLVRYHRPIRIISGTIMIIFGFLMIADLMGWFSGFAWLS